MTIYCVYTKEIHLLRLDGAVKAPVVGFLNILATWREWSEAQTVDVKK